MYKKSTNMLKINKSERINAKLATFSRTKGCECREWGFDKTTNKSPAMKPYTHRRGRCLPTCLSFFISLNLREQKK